MRARAPVDADGGEVEDGRRTAHDVTSHPRVAHYVAECPRGVVHLRRSQIGHSAINECTSPGNSFQRLQSPKSENKIGYIPLHSP